MAIRKRIIAQIRKFLGNNETNQFYLYSADLAEFKQINYIYGFDAGDQLLDDLTKYIKQIPHCVFCERVISDRFFFLVREDSPRAEEELLANYDYYWNQFVSIKQAQFPVCPLKLWCGCYHIEGMDVSMALDNADMARQKAREIGSHTAVFFESSIVEEVMEQKRREAAAIQALQEKRFTFYLQPQVDLTTGQIVGAEALARCITPDGETIPPSHFIPAMEKNGSIVELDFLILEQVCQNIRMQLDQGKPVIRISVNLSRLHLRNPKTVNRIQSVVTKYQIPPEYLMFELTEDIILNSFAAANQIGTSLNQLGYKTSIDDFGAGFAGIDACRHLFFNELKLDKSFLDALPNEYTRNQIIMEGLVGIMKKLGSTVICEGVETANQCQDLLHIGCHLIQGFYISKPVPPQRFYEKYQELDGKYPLDFLYQDNPC